MPKKKVTFLPESVHLGGEATHRDKEVKELNPVRLLIESIRDGDTSAINLAYRKLKAVYPEYTINTPLPRGGKYGGELVLNYAIKEYLSVSRRPANVIECLKILKQYNTTFSDDFLQTPIGKEIKDIKTILTYRQQLEQVCFEEAELHFTGKRLYSDLRNGKIDEIKELCTRLGTEYNINSFQMPVKFPGQPKPSLISVIKMVEKELLKRSKDDYVHANLLLAVIKHLMEHGAKPAQCNREGESAITIFEASTPHDSNLSALLDRYIEPKPTHTKPPAAKPTISVGPTPKKASPTEHPLLTTARNGDLSQFKESLRRLHGTSLSSIISSNDGGNVLHHVVRGYIEAHRRGQDTKNFIEMARILVVKLDDSVSVCGDRRGHNPAAVFVDETKDIEMTPNDQEFRNILGSPFVWKEEKSPASTEHPLLTAARNGDLSQFKESLQRLHGTSLSSIVSSTDGGNVWHQLARGYAKALKEEHNTSGFISIANILKEKNNECYLTTADSKQRNPGLVFQSKLQKYGIDLNTRTFTTDDKKFSYFLGSPYTIESRGF